MSLSWAAKPAVIPEAIHEKLKMPFFLPAWLLLCSLFCCYATAAAVGCMLVEYVHMSPLESGVFLSRPLLFFTVRLLIFISLSMHAHILKIINK
jgi:hypothetical protein